MILDHVLAKVPGHLPVLFTPCIQLKGLGDRPRSMLYQWTNLNAQ